MKKNHQMFVLTATVATLVSLCAAGVRVLTSNVTATNEPKPGALHGQAALEQLKQDGQYESLRAAMNQARFSVSHSARSPLGRAAWHAPNQAAGYDAYVTESSVSIAVNKNSLVSVSLHSIGYGTALRAVRSGQVSGDAQTIQVLREGGVREWYVNGENGLEQGFTLSEPPGIQGNEPLRLVLEVSDPWRAIASDDGKLVTLLSDDGQAVEYSKLVVRDNQGCNIPARLKINNSQIVIEVEDNVAVYPLTIDPLFTLQQEIKAADGAAQDLFGHTVAVDGDTALIGAPYDDVTNPDQGSAYVFVRNGSVWTQQARLFAQDGANLDLFGWVVALDGNTALIGAKNGPGVASADQGAAYVFVRQGSTWSQQGRLNASDGVAAGSFGSVLALDGDTAVVGAPHYRVSAILAPGAAYVFLRNGSVWTQQARLTANDGEDNDEFGAAVAVQEGTAIIGAPADDVGTNVNQGTSYVFTRNGLFWAPRQRLTTNDGAAGDLFGNAIAISGETALIGAYRRSIDDVGLVYVFDRRATGWTETTTIQPVHCGPGAQFGISVALSGDRAVIGASLMLFSPGVDQRSAFVFVRRGGSFLEARQFGPELGTADDRFGYAVAIDGDTVLVGAYWSDAGTPNQGSAYAFVMHDSQHIDRQKLIAQDGKSADYFGEAVAIDGNTLVVGAGGDDVDDNANQGSIYIFARTGTAWTFQSKVTAPDGAEGDYFGRSVAISGDTLVAGAYADDIETNANQGSAYVFKRTGTEWALQKKLTASAMDGKAGDNFGFSVALEGDTVVVGAIGVNNSQGSAYIFTRTGTSWTQEAKITANDGASGDEFGYAVAYSANTLVAGAHFDSIGNNAAQGSAYMFTRAGTTWTQRTKLMANDGGEDERFGGAVALSGDTVVVGAYFAKVGQKERQGSAYVFVRRGIAWVQAQKLMASDGEADDRFGTSVTINHSIIVVGAEYDTNQANSNQGSAYVFTFVGSWHPQQKLMPSDGVTQGYFGHSVAVNGDTVVVGASGDDIDTDESDIVNKNESQGSAYVFNSPACQPITIAPESLPNAIAGLFYVRFLTPSGGSGSDEYRRTLTRGSLPPGLSLDPFSINGTATTPGTYRFTITATHFLSGCAGSVEYTITVLATCQSLTINPATLPNGTNGAAYVQALTIANGASPFTISLGAGSTLPPGISLVSGLVFGTATQAGTFNFTLNVKDANGCTGTRSFSITIIQLCTISPSFLPFGKLNTAYSQTLTATGDTPPYSFAITTGALPPGLSLSASGVLSGTPTQPGSFSFSVSTTANGCSGTRAYKLVVSCISLSVSPGVLPPIPRGKPYSQSITTTGGGEPYRYTLSGGTLPSGLSLSTTGVLSGTPTQAGSSEFSVTVQDSGSCAAFVGYTLVVTDCSYSVAPTSRSFAASAATGDFMVTAGEGCSWNVSSQPSWLTITSGASGSGNGQVVYNVAANTGAAREAMLNVAGQTHLVKQEAATVESPRLTRLAPNSVRMGTDGITLNVIGSGFTTSQRVRWNGNDYDTVFDSATQLRAIIPAALLANEGNATVMVIDNTTGAQSNSARFRVVGAVAHASAASYDTISLAPDSLVAAFGVNLAAETRGADGLPLPTELAGTTVKVRDSQNVTKVASLLFVSPNQVNYVMPVGLANGVATVTITNGDGLDMESLTEISTVAPGLFSASASGEGPAAAAVLRVRENGEQVYEAVARYDAGAGTFVLLPIDLSSNGEEVYLVLYGTGIRLRDSLDALSIRIGEVELAALYAGPAPPFVGLDQVNVLVPTALSGRGEQTVSLRISGQISNVVKVRFQ